MTLPIIPDQHHHLASSSTFMGEDRGIHKLMGRKLSHNEFDNCKPRQQQLASVR